MYATTLDRQDMRVDKYEVVCSFQKCHLYLGIWYFILSAKEKSQFLSPKKSGCKIYTVGSISMKHWDPQALNAARNHVSWALRRVYMCVLIFTKVL